MRTMSVSLIRESGAELWLDVLLKWQYQPEPLQPEGFWTVVKWCDAGGDWIHLTKSERERLDEAVARELKHEA